MTFDNETLKICTISLQVILNNRKGVSMEGSRRVNLGEAPE